MTLRSLFTAVAAVAAVGFAASAQPANGPFVTLDRETEIEYALSAAPAHLREGAGLFVLETRGYARVRPSRNGFDCIVARVDRVIAPMCLDAEGSATNLKTVLREGELFLAGKSRPEVDTIVAEEYKSGKLIAPRRNGIAYMLSPHFKQFPEGQEPKTVFAPHLMFYAPYLKNSDIGASPAADAAKRRPFILDEGKPTAYIIVVYHGEAASAHTAAEPTR